MKVVFIGCGYLGHNLSKGLIDKYDVNILGIDSPYVQYSPWFRYADVFDMGTMINQDLQDAIVIDTVSLVGNRTTSDNPDKLLRSIKYKYQGLLDVLKAKGVKRFIFFSSGGTIYGDSEMPIKEEHELNPKSLYGKSKMMLEKLIQDSGIDYLILRPSNPFGGFQITNGQGVIPILINKALNQEPFDMYVDSDSVRDYFYIDDFVDILDKLIEKNISYVGDDLWKMVAGEKHKKYVPSYPEIKTDKIPVPDLGVVASTRELSGVYLESLLASGASLIGGSADLGYNTNAKTHNSVDIVPPEFHGNYINFGVREHAMGAIMNGMAVAGLRPYGSTFLVFSDYMRPAVRLAAMSELPVIYIFSHDSIAVGADGPTHQPVEQLPSLRLIPNLNVYRPCNVAEVAYAWQLAIADVHNPSAIILSRQKFAQISTPKNADMSRGAYIIHPATARRVRVTIIATGAEVPLAVDVAKKLGDAVQVVSMPSVADFRRQNEKYKSKILAGFVVAIEAAATVPWFEFADAVVGVDSFGMSGPGGAVYSNFGFDTDTIARDILKKLK